jgi:citrate lyase subunit beta/citryl-CoA lyase
LTVAATPARRSCLSVPGSAEGKLRKAAGLGADEVIIDLEDSVTPATKDAARAAVVAALASWPPDAAVAVRVNAPRTPWCHADLAALAELPERPGSIVLPKVESAGDLAFVDRLLDGVEATAGRRRPLSVQALIETAAGLDRVTEIALSSPRLDSLILGYADLAVSLGGSREPDEWLPVQDRLLVAARAAALQAIDGPYLGVKADEGFYAAAARARGLGFDGKWAIHPAQVAPLNEVFTPTAEELEWARAVISALERAQDQSAAGAVALDGQMLDEAVRRAALRVLAQAGEAHAAGSGTGGQRSL